jgi:hypothetical protein
MRDLAILEKKLSTLIIDPSVITSDIHVRKLLSVKKKLFIPATLFEVIREREKVYNILRYFVWSPRQVKLPAESLKLIERAEIYKHKEENIQDVFPKLDRLNIPFYVKKILLEEYSFLKENSTLLLRFQKTLQYFRNMGILTLNLMNKLKDEKEQVFNQIRGPRWVATILLECSAFFEQDPFLRIIREISGFIFVIFDP